MNDKQHIRKALLLYVLFTAVIYLSNRLMAGFNMTGEMWMRTTSLILMVLIAIPVTGIILPVYLAKKWELTYSYWPRNKNSLHVMMFLAFWFLLINFKTPAEIQGFQILSSDFLVHFIKAFFFLIATYTLFMILLFPVLRKRYGLWWSLFGIAVLYLLYFQAQYYFFPAGHSLVVRAYLFLTIIAYLLIYIWSESIILTAFIHSLSYALMLMSEDIMLMETDITFWGILIILIGTIIYASRDCLKKWKIPQENPDFWIYINLKD